VGDNLGCVFKFLIFMIIQMETMEYKKNGENVQEKTR
jgi:hypothetical protein